MKTRPDWDTYFLNIARAVAARADCTRRQIGCVIVDDDHRILATGYNGSPPGGPSCLAGECPRGQHYRQSNIGLRGDISAWCACGSDWPCAYAVPPDSSYDSGPGVCEAVHAEANALLFARASVKGATLFCTDLPCPGCTRLIKGAGIARVVTLNDPEPEPEHARIAGQHYQSAMGPAECICGADWPCKDAVEPEPGPERLPDLVDLSFVDRNRVKDRYPLDDPPICERKGCGHLLGHHLYDKPTGTHSTCTIGCGCSVPMRGPYLRAS